MTKVAAHQLTNKVLADISNTLGNNPVVDAVRRFEKFFVNVKGSKISAEDSYKVKALLKVKTEATIFSTFE